jgi:hypothetical protein
LKLRYLPTSSDGPVLLFQDADPHGARTLLEAFEALAEGQRLSVDLHALPEVQPADGCRLVGLASDAPRQDLTVEPTTFLWRLRRIQWETVAGLVQPFVDPEPAFVGHQYLGNAGSATVIISTTDRW